MIKCDECGLEYLEWGRDEMCPRCKNRVKEIDTIESLTAERDKLKAERDELMEFIKKSPVAFGQDADHNEG
jgi:transcription initiation factor IIE alpha subunit